MRLLFLILFAVLTAAAAPFLVFAIRPDLMPAGASVAQGWEDLVEVGRVMLESWRAGEGLNPPDAIRPAGIDEVRLKAALAVASAAGLWLAAFVVGGLFSLPLLRLRLRTLAVVALLLAVLPAACVTVSFEMQSSPEEERVLRDVLLCLLAGLAAGFLTVQTFRRIAV